MAPPKARQQEKPAFSSSYSLSTLTLQTKDPLNMLSGLVILPSPLTAFFSGTISSHILLLLPHENYYTIHLHVPRWKSASSIIVLDSGSGSTTTLARGHGCSWRDLVPSSAHLFSRT